MCRSLFDLWYSAHELATLGEFAIHSMVLSGHAPSEVEHEQVRALRHEASVLLEEVLEEKRLSMGQAKRLRTQLALLRRSSESMATRADRRGR